MCSVSAVSQYYQQDYRDRFGINPFQGQLNQPALGGLQQTVVVHQADAETKEMMRQVIKMLDQIDKRLGDIECMDAEKAAFLKTLDIDPNNINGG